MPTSRLAWLALGLFGLSGTLVGITPMGISLGASPFRQAGEWAFLGGLIGVWVGLERLTPLRPVLLRAQPSARLAFELRTLSTPIVLLAFAGVCPRAVQAGDLSLFAAVLLPAAHLLAMSWTWARCVPARRGLSLVLPWIVWLLPVLLRQAEPSSVLHAVSHLVDPTREWIGYNSSQFDATLFAKTVLSMTSPLVFWMALGLGGSALSSRR